MYVRTELKRLAWDDLHQLLSLTTTTTHSVSPVLRGALHLPIMCTYTYGYLQLHREFTSFIISNSHPTSPTVRHVPILNFGNTVAAY